MSSSSITKTIPSGSKSFTKINPMDSSFPSIPISTPGSNEMRNAPTSNLSGLLHPLLPLQNPIRSESTRTEGENSSKGGRTMTPYKHFFGFQREPFPQDIKVEDLYPLPGLKALADRFHYALDLGALNVITGEVGTGKSTSLRYAASPLHPSQYRIIPVTANTGTI